MDTLQFQPGWQDSDRMDAGRDEKLSHKARSLGHRRQLLFGVAKQEERMLEADQIIFSIFPHGLAY